jgi:CDGSH-type Zn-finger protein
MTEETTTDMRIRIMPNGPYHVSGSVPLTERYADESVYGEPLAWDPVGVAEESQTSRATYALCRCGQSANKPFCDGSHARLGFDGTLTADRAPSATRRTTQVGTGMVMTDDPELCVNAGFCGTRLTNVWDMMERTGDPEIRARAQAMIQYCPSGRLQWAPAEGAAPVEPAFTPSIATVPDGPLWVRGGLAIEAPDGYTYEVRNRVTLCRCGQSRNKPFCDGTHKDAGFQAPRRDQQE